jgi:aconitate hydratase
MAGSPYNLRMPRVLGVELHGRLQPGITAKDIIFEILRRLTVKGGVGKVLEYYGPGAANLDVPERATITNMGAELGATTSLFPSDARTLAYLTRQQRAQDFTAQAPDPDATYDEHMRLDLDTLEPLIARPDSPDNVCPISEVRGIPVHQVAIGSCTNSSYSDLMTVAAMLKGKTVHPQVSLVITPGSRQVLHMIARNGALADLIAAGARILESACGPCAGMGQVPSFNAVSIRSFNRNFPGRSGGIENRVYLASPAACAAAALAGEIADPRAFATAYIGLPDTYLVDDSGIFPPAAAPETIEIRRGPNIKPLPTRADLEETLSGEVLLKLGDNISTDHILPAGPQVLPLRSNVPAIAEYLFRYVDPAFVERVKARSGGFIVAAQNYGQGSSREHAALCPMFFGVKAILAKSFARIHRDNLINYAVLPLAFSDVADYDTLDPEDQLEISDVRQRLEDGATRIPVYNRTKQTTFETTLALTDRERRIVLAGGLLRYVGKESGQ